MTTDWHIFWAFIGSIFGGVMLILLALSATNSTANYVERRTGSFGLGILAGSVVYLAITLPVAGYIIATFVPR